MPQKYAPFFVYLDRKQNKSMTDRLPTEHTQLTYLRSNCKRVQLWSVRFLQQNRPKTSNKINYVTHEVNSN